MTDRLPTPELDVEKMVNGAMKMREAVDGIVSLCYLEAKTPEQISVVDDLAHVIKSQQGLIDFQVEKYIQLAELMDKTYDLLNNFIDKNKGN